LGLLLATTDLGNLSRDPEVAKAYVSDKYTTNKISLRSGPSVKERTVQRCVRRGLNMPSG
jgi:hypothetical protein